jgi:hypothetical protein
MKTISEANPRAKTGSRRLSGSKAIRRNRRDHHIQTALKRRIGDVVPISVLVPFVLAATLAEGTRRKEGNE